jgi:hypothetical protein
MGFLISTLSSSVAILSFMVLFKGQKDMKERLTDLSGLKEQPRVMLVAVLDIVKLALTLHTVRNCESVAT